MRCLVCLMPTQSLWKKKPVCVDCRKLAKQYMEERPTATMRHGLIATSEMIRAAFKKHYENQVTEEIKGGGNQVQATDSDVQSYV